MTTSETKITDDQLRTLQQVFPEGGVMLVNDGPPRLAKSGEIVRSSSDNFQPFYKVVGETIEAYQVVNPITIPPLDPARVRRFEAWWESGKVALPSRDEDTSKATAWRYFQSWEKFKGFGECDEIERLRDRVNHLESRLEAVRCCIRGIAERNADRSRFVNVTGAIESILSIDDDCEASFASAPSPDQRGVT